MSRHLNYTLLGLLFLVVMSGTRYARIGNAQSCATDQEPNDTPAEATPLDWTAGCIEGEMADDDQDAFRWTVSEKDAGTRWTFAVEGIADELTRVEVFRIEYAENGEDVADYDTLYDFGTQDGSRRIFEDILFEPGDYVLGVSTSGGDGAYRVDIRSDGELPESGDAEPNDDADTATPVESVFELSGDLEGSRDWFVWTLSDADAEQRWQIESQGPVDTRLDVSLYDADRNELTSIRAGDDGHGILYDLGLEAGTYYLRVSPDYDRPLLYSLTATATDSRAPDKEEEPNGTGEGAYDVDLSGPVTGRLARHGDTDYYHFTLDEDYASRILDLTLESDSDGKFEVCLQDDDGRRLQCREGTEQVSLVDLALDARPYRAYVEGDVDPDASYTLELTRAGRLSPDIEVEPNDQFEYAAPLNDQNAIRGRFVGRESDYYRFVVEGDPQLWRIQAVGEGLRELGYYNAAGTQTMRTRSGQRRMRLSNVFLLPGEHYIGVNGEDGEYQIRALPIGPPNPDAEREPNGDLSRAHKLRFGQTRTGLLDQADDRDYYRFFLPVEQHVLLRIAPPADGDISFDLRVGSTYITDGRSPEPGDEMLYEAVLPAGDYELALDVRTPSDNPYEITLERGDPFIVPANIEPNNEQYQARSLPPSLEVSGIVGNYHDDDWYVLPELAETSEMTISNPNEQKVYLYDADENWLRDDLVWNSDTRTYTATVPAGVTRYVQVDGSGSYRLSFAFDNGPTGRSTPLDTIDTNPLIAPVAHTLRQLAAVQETGMPVQTALSVETNAVAAYWLQGQRVAGELALVNRGETPVNLDLEAVSSHYLWTPVLEQTTISLDAGESATVPVTINVEPDAWADQPVYVTVAARDVNAPQRIVTTDTVLRASREAPPINPQQTWPLPEDLLSGVNAAWLGLGAQIRTENEAWAERQSDLHDNITPLQDGFSWSASEAPITLTVELAGDSPVPVAGITLNPTGEGRTGQRLNEFDVALSTDGDTYTTVYSGVLSTRPVEQAFVLDDAVPARFARLILRSNHVGNTGNILLGEWKVIAAPGRAIAGAQSLNLANPDLGGHVVWYSPQMRGLANMLSEEDEAPTTRLNAGERAEWVIGFQHERAAQITELQWRDASDRNMENDFTAVDVWVSMESPIGPWEPLGTWQLDRAVAGDGPMTFALEAPVWARYVRFRTPPVEERIWRNFPATLRIFERSAEGESYRSVLAEWGHYNRDAVYEWLNPTIFTPPALTEDDNDTRDTADALALNEERAGQVQIEQDEDWFTLDVPEGQNTLTFNVIGDPTVTVRLRLQNEAGDEIPLRIKTAAPKRQVLKATVEPGARYYLHVEEPPRSVVFSWDTSGSVNPYSTIIYNALSSFAEDVSPGREAVNFLPFGGDFLLEEWGTEPYLLRQTLNNYDRSDNSSSAEATLLQATDELAPREGTKAIIFITDAASPSSDKTAELWRALREVQPRIFTLAVSSAGALSSHPFYEQDLMETWAAVNGGHYDYLRSQGAMEIGFDRASTWLRRPADYVISATASFEEPPGPGTLQLVSESDDPDTDAPVLQSGTVELILDASGSMLQQMEGGRRIDVAKDVLIDLTTNTLPAGTPLALRVFGHKESGTCRTDLEIPLQALDPPAVQSTIDGINAQNLAKTPIADSLRLVAEDLADADPNGQRTVVLVTDGEETCEGDPGAAIQFLKDAGIDVRVNIVGFAIADEVLKKQFQRWAELGGGQYFDATGADELGESIERALRVPFRVRNSDGDVIAEGVVDGETIKVPAGVYTIEVLTEPVQTYNDVQIGGEESVQLTITP